MSKLYFVTDDGVALKFVGPDLVAALRVAGSTGFDELGYPILASGRELFAIEALPWVAEPVEAVQVSAALSTGGKNA